MRKFLSKKDFNKYLKEYEVLMDYLNNKNNIFWERFRTILTINSILFSVVVLSSNLISLTFLLKIGYSIVCALGIFFSVVWILNTSRVTANLNIRRGQARELENRLGLLGIYSQGKKFASGEKVVVGNESYELKSWQRWKTIKMHYLIPRLFLILWIILIPFIWSYELQRLI